VGPNVNNVRLLLPNLSRVINQMGPEPILAYREIVRNLGSRKKKHCRARGFFAEPDTRGRSSWLDAETTDPYHSTIGTAYHPLGKVTKSAPLYIILAGIYKLFAAYGTESSHFPFLHVLYAGIALYY
jgi:hypothetical protein